MNKNKNYCLKCGLELRRIEIDEGFDLYTGERAYSLLWKCPKKKWWNGHYEIRSDKDGDTYSYYS